MTPNSFPTSSQTSTENEKSIDNASIEIADLDSSLTNENELKNQIDMESQIKSPQKEAIIDVDQRLEADENSDNSTPRDSFAHELADIQAKTHDIEAMIDKYLSKK